MYYVNFEQIYKTAFLVRTSSPVNIGLLKVDVTLWIENELCYNKH